MVSSATRREAFSSVLDQVRLLPGLEHVHALAYRCGRLLLGVGLDDEKGAQSSNSACANLYLSLRTCGKLPAPRQGAVFTVASRASGT